jgi:hypothetical protein
VEGDELIELNSKVVGNFPGIDEQFMHSSSSYGLGGQVPIWRRS